MFPFHPIVHKWKEEFHITLTVPHTKERNNIDHDLKSYLWQWSSQICSLSGAQLAAFSYLEVPVGESGGGQKYFWWLLLALYCGNSAALPFSRRLWILIGFLAETFTRLWLAYYGQCILTPPHLLHRFFRHSVKVDSIKKTTIIVKSDWNLWNASCFISLNSQ